MKPYNVARVLTGTPIEVNRELVKIAESVNAPVVNSGETDHGSVIHGNGAIPFLNPGGAVAGMWQLFVRSSAGSTLHGAALYVSNGSTTSILDLGTTAGGTWSIYATDGKSPVFVNVSGGPSTLVTSYLKVQ